MNPWQKLFYHADRMDLPKITPDQLNAGMTLCSTAFRARHQLLPVEACRETLRHLKDKCHSRLVPLVELCLVQDPDKAEWVKV